MENFLSFDIRVFYYYNIKRFYHLRFTGISIPSELTQKIYKAV